MNDTSTIGILNYCVWNSLSPLPSSYIFAISYLALCLSVANALIEYLWIATAYGAILPKKGRFGIVGSSMGGSSGILFVSWREIKNDVKWVSSWFGE